MDTYAFSDRENSVSKRSCRVAGNWALSGLASATAAGAGVDWDGGAENGDGALEAVATRANAAGTLPGLEE